MIGDERNGLCTAMYESTKKMLMPLLDNRKNKFESKRSLCGGIGGGIPRV